MDTIELTPAEMSDRTGVTIDTLRYYERKGLIQPVARSRSGHRRYSQDDVLWVTLLRCLRDTGMPIAELRRYCELSAEGDTSESDRMTMLLEHRKRVLDQIEREQEALRLIEYKLSFYPGYDPSQDSTAEPDA